MGAYAAKYVKSFLNAGYDTPENEHGTHKSPNGKGNSSCKL